MRINGVNNTQSFGMAYKIGEDASYALRKYAKENKKIKPEKALETMSYLEERFKKSLLKLSIFRQGGYDYDGNDYFRLILKHPNIPTNVEKTISAKTLLTKGKGVSKKMLKEMDGIFNKDAANKARKQVYKFRLHEAIAKKAAQSEVTESFIDKTI